jgi:hypothetical protein
MNDLAAELSYPGSSSPSRGPVFLTSMMFPALRNCLAGSTSRPSHHYRATFVMQMSAFGTSTLAPQEYIYCRGRPESAHNGAGLPVRDTMLLFIGLVMYGTDLGRYTTLHEFAF